MKETVSNFQYSLIVSYRKKNHVPITWELELVSLVLHASFIIHSMLPLEHTLWLDLLPQQLFLHQVYHMEGFLHGQHRECRIYLGWVFNLICLLFCLLHKALYLCRAGTTTWLVKDVEYICICCLLWSYFFIFHTVVIWFMSLNLVLTSNFLCMNHCKGSYRCANYFEKKKKDGVWHCILPLSCLTEM